MNRLALLVAGAFFMEFLDGTIIIPALPRIAGSLGTTAVDLNAAVSAYMLTVAVCILPSGWLAERYGARRVFTGAVVLFTAASALCGLATSPAAFIAARMLQGVGGAMMVPVGRLGVLRTTPKDRIVHAMALLTWPALSAPLVGPPLGGVLADYAGWRWIFFVNLPLGLVAIPFALRLMPGGATRNRLPFDRPPSIGPLRLAPFDWLGFVWTALVLGALTTGLDALADTGATAARAAIPLAVALAAAFVLVRHIRHHPHPIVQGSALAVQTFRESLVNGSAMRILISAMPFLLPLMVQLGWGRSAAEAGSLTLALFVGNLGIKPLTTPILRRCGFRRVMFANGLIQAGAMLACAALGPATPLPAVLAAFLVAGASRSMQFTALNTLVYADVPQPMMGMANSLFSVAFQLSAGLGIAAGAVALRLSSAAAARPAPTLADFRVTLVALALLMLLASLRVLVLPADAGAAVSGARLATTGR